MITNNPNRVRNNPNSVNNPNDSDKFSATLITLINPNQFFVGLLFEILFNTNECLLFFVSHRRYSWKSFILIVHVCMCCLSVVSLAWSEKPPQWQLKRPLWFSWLITVSAASGGAPSLWALLLCFRGRIHARETMNNNNSTYNSNLSWEYDRKFICACCIALLAF
jgi:hypothetical protein